MTKKKKRLGKSTETKAQQSMLAQELRSGKYRQRVEKDKTKYSRNTKHRNKDCGDLLFDKPKNICYNRDIA